MNKILETKRLYFKPFTENDFELLYKLHSSPEVMKYIPANVQNIEEIKESLANEIDHQKKYGFSKWAVYLKSNDEFIGRAGFSKMDNSQIEVGYGFLPEFWNQGFATETLSNLLDWARKNIETKEIIAFTHPDNIGSKKVIEQANMIFLKQSLVHNVLYDFYYIRFDNFDFSYNKELTKDEKQWVEDGFAKLAFEARNLGPMEEFSISIHDEQKNLVATISGSIYYGCLYIDTLFIDEELRHKNYGTELMQKAETLAQEKKCLFINLTTMDWEARGFYEKLGYRLEFERIGYKNGAKLYSMRKDL